MQISTNNVITVHRNIPSTTVDEHIHLRSGSVFWLWAHTGQVASWVQTWASSRPPGSPLQTGNAQRIAKELEWPSCLEYWRKYKWNAGFENWLTISCIAMCVCWILPLVLFRKMVATRSFQESWKRVSCTRLKGERGGVHFLKAFLLGGLRPMYTWLYSINAEVHIYILHFYTSFLFDSCIKWNVEILPSVRGFLLK